MKKNKDGCQIKETGSATKEFWKTIKFWEQKESEISELQILQEERRILYEDLPNAGYVTDRIERNAMGYNHELDFAWVRFRMVLGKR